MEQSCKECPYNTHTHARTCTNTCTKLTTNPIQQNHPVKESFLKTHQTNIKHASSQVDIDLCLVIGGHGTHLLSVYGPWRSSGLCAIRTLTHAGTM